MLLASNPLTGTIAMMDDLKSSIPYPEVELD